MGYSSKQELVQALANALSQGSPTQPQQLVDITTIGKMVADTVTDAQIYQYINWADENIDAWLSGMYATPLKRINRGSYPVAMDVTVGDMQAILQDATRFTPGDIVLIRDDVNKQSLTIGTVPDEHTIVFTGPVTNSYSLNNTNIERVRYPDPIPKCSARMAAAYLYDKHFAAQVDGNESDFGKFLRNAVKADINGILSGMIRLEIADAGFFQGRRYYNAGLDDAINSRAKPGDEWLKPE